MCNLYKIKMLRKARLVCTSISLYLDICSKYSYGYCFLMIIKGLDGTQPPKVGYMLKQFTEGNG